MIRAHWNPPNTTRSAGPSSGRISAPAKPTAMPITSRLARLRLGAIYFKIKNWGVPTVQKLPGIGRMSVKDAYFWNAPC
jgi:hypothetical protein